MPIYSKRLQRAKYGAAPSSSGKAVLVKQGDGSFIQVTDGSVINFGGNGKAGLAPSVGVGLNFLLLAKRCPCNMMLTLSNGRD